MKKNQEGYEAHFDLFGYEFHKSFRKKTDAQLFFENLKKSYITEIYSVDECISRYLTNVSVGKAKSSYKLDERCFDRFKNFLFYSAKSPLEPITSLTCYHVEGFQNYMTRYLKLSPSSVNRYMNTLKNFFKKCHEWDLIVKNPARFIEPLMEDPEVKGTWSEKDFDAVIKTLNENDQLLISFLKLTGCRLSSAVNLRWGDVDFSSNSIKFLSRKGRRKKQSFYFFPLHDKLKKILKKSNSQNSSDFVFLRACGRPYTAPMVSRKITKALRKPQVQSITKGKRLSAHAIRHTFATKMLSEGVGIHEVKSLLGHSTVRMTERYLHSDTSELVKKLNKIA